MSASLCLLCVRDKEMRLKQKNEMKMKIQKKNHSTSPACVM